MTNQNNILTEEEIKELIGSLNRNPSEAEIGAVIDYFWLRPYALKHLEDKEFRKSFVRLIYLHKIALDGYKKADKEVKSLWSLTTNLEQERNELLEINKQLEEEQKVLEEALELEEDISKCHLDALEVARQWRVRQSKEKDDNLEKASRKIEVLENVVTWQNYLTNKQLQELPTLPKKQNKFKLLTNKVKSRIKQAKAITQEKFNTYILQKDK